jgi:hypothetical protein
MKRLLGCILLLGGSLAAQSVQSTLLALKDSHAARKALSNQLVDEMMTIAKSDQSPSRATVQRYSEELTGALLGKDVTMIRAAALQKAITGVLSGKGSTFLPACSLYETLAGFRIDDRTIQVIVDGFREIGQEVRGPDDLPVLPVRDITRK